MAVQIARYRFSDEQYEQMIEAGLFPPDARLELIKGEIVEMTPIGPRHMACVARLELLLHEQVGRKAIVFTQNSIRLPGGSQPQPDLALLKWRDDFYRSRRPDPQDVLLLIEVADTSLAYDRGEKVPLYAQAGIADLWIVNLLDENLEIYSTPMGGAFADVKRADKGDIVTLPGGLAGAIRVDEILG